MTESDTSTGLALTVNGSKLAVGRRPNLVELDPALRSVALSDSPVFVKAPKTDQEHLLQRLHNLGRRARLPLHRCLTPSDAGALFGVLTSPSKAEHETLGTWSLFSVESWPTEHQEQLGKLLEALDLARLHGRLRHEKIPRVVVMANPEATPDFIPDLRRRVSYFSVLAQPEQPKEPAHVLPK